ncbi:MAG TPA: flagellar protein export ATPase FliI [Chloroflexota bacterium]|nr:flagellar protein export ATPase FliI [Chloroflexota bacterium]
MTPTLDRVEQVDLGRFHHTLDELDPLRCSGRIVQVIGLTVEAVGLACQMGEVCEIRSARMPEAILAEVVGFRDDRVLLMPLGEMHGIAPGNEVVSTGAGFSIVIGPQLVGRIVDGLGRPIDGKGPISGRHYGVGNAPPAALLRQRIDQPLATGVRAIDGLLTCGKGQRLGIFAGSGVGKSTLLGMVARGVTADINVIALIGERGREVREFVERDLGPEGLKRSIVVVSTSDQPALVRVKGAWVATAIAEYFREQGLHVSFLMDSVTRFAMAQREIGLTIGEPPAAKGYTPSVFAMLPKLMERTGASEKGTITGFYTVLVEGDDLQEPITDTVRSILDGHIVLSRELAAENHYPAIDVLASVSRLMSQVAAAEHKEAAALLREVLATYANARDLVNIGAYVSGSNPAVDYALAAMPRVREFLRQIPEELADYEPTVKSLRDLFDLPSAGPN